MNIQNFILNITSLDTSLEIWGNTLNNYITALLVFVLLVVVFKFVQWLLLRKLAHLAKKTKTDVDDTFIVIINSLRPELYYFLAIFFSIKLITVTAFTSTVINSILLIWIVYQVVVAVQILIDYVIKKKVREEGGEEGQGMVKMLGGMVKWILWIIGGLMILSNLGINVSSLVAGLGIGGIAIALALQNVLSDLFSSFSIYFDKPFVVGDFITTGSHSGTVEKIGIKTTRIRAVQGEEIVISNQELTSARVQNFKRMEERRIVTKLGLVYDTSSEKLDSVTSIIKEIVDSEGGVRFDRVFFTEFADSALIFEFVYHVLSKEYSDYLKAQQNINFEIKKKFEKEGIEFAYPTQTIYVSK